jgi:hypothetical protein
VTKLFINSESPEESVHFPEAIAGLPETAVIAYHVYENLLYVRDDYVAAAVSYLKAIGIQAEVLERGEQ